MEDSIFTKIIKRDVPAEVLYEDEKVIVILDRFPNTVGQTLVITKTQTPYLFALDEESYLYLMRIAKHIASALDATYQPLRTCMIVEGFEVPHVHIRLYPIQEGPLSLASGDMASDETLKTEGDRIREHIKISS